MLDTCIHARRMERLLYVRIRFKSCFVFCFKNLIHNIHRPLSILPFRFDPILRNNFLDRQMRSRTNCNLDNYSILPNNDSHHVYNQSNLKYNLMLKQRYKCVLINHFLMEATEMWESPKSGRRRHISSQPNR